ncbi:MAG: Endonuclease/Exonuclease/phosphatase family protein [Burkholderiales bacterium]|jgi:hypothetical protein|nr:Endonuclease/Exonuclease/phosphatase family protein [Burkholderiales bacterium]
MLKFSKFLSTTFFILLGIFNSAQAADIKLLDINVEAWRGLNPGQKAFNGAGFNYFRYISRNQPDFVTTQEDDGGSLTLIDPYWGNLGLSYAMAGPNGDAVIYYKKDSLTGWTELGRMQMDITYDSILPGFSRSGQRIATMSKFRNNSSGKVVVIATTHYCVPWGESRGCKKTTEPELPGQTVDWAAHRKDSRDIANQINAFAGGAPVIFTGDLNNIDSPGPQGDDIANTVFTTAGLKRVEKTDYVNNRPPYNGGRVIDFAFYRDLTLDGLAKAYIMWDPADGDGQNKSDHDGILVSFNFGDTPPPVVCPAPVTYEASYDPVSKDVNITVDSTAFPEVTEVKLMNYNSSKTFNPVAGSPNKPVYKDAVGAPPPAPNGYLYKVQNICGSNNFSSIQDIWVK